MKTGRTVVITGAAGGMGAAFVRRFLDNGDVVIAADRAEETLARLAGSMNSARLHARCADVTDEADTRALARVGPPDQGASGCAGQCRRLFPGAALPRNNRGRLAQDHRHQPDRHGADVSGDVAADDRARLGPDR